MKQEGDKVIEKLTKEKETEEGLWKALEKERTHA